jgi:hypothetical protein
VQYGVRADGNRFLFRPSFNAALRDTLGIRNDVAPNRIYFSPRVGVQWTYGTAPAIAYAPGVARPPLAVIHAVAGIFQNIGTANVLSDAAAQTGLPTSTRSIACVGPAAPVADWTSYARDLATIPSSCADGSSGTVFSTAAPSVLAFDRRFEQPRSFRTAADWSSPVLDNRFVLGVQGVFSWNMNQPGIVDVNLDPAGGFTLPPKTVVWSSSIRRPSSRTLVRLPSLIRVGRRPFATSPSTDPIFIRHRRSWS